MFNVLNLKSQVYQFHIEKASLGFLNLERNRIPIFQSLFLILMSFQHFSSRLVIGNRFVY
jgi:hypothetical protein